MLYTYKYLKNHNIQKLHEYIEHFFEEMYKRNSKRFNQNIIHKDFFKLVKKKEVLLLIPMKEIYKEFKSLDKSVQKKILDNFKNNNSIAELCRGNKSPLKYIVLAKISKPLSKVIKTFFGNLYTEIINKEIFDSKTKHFIKFRKLNGENIVCPFCGLESLLGEEDGEDGKKDDYDHWLSKGKYPFSSINFKNLIPMCSRCNQKYKSQKDTLYFQVKKGGKWNRRQVFYPYGNKAKLGGINVSIDKRVSSLKNDNSWGIHLKGDAKLTGEIESWDQIFDIKSRYKNRIKIRYKRSWYEHVRKLYKTKKGSIGFDFNDFKKDIYNGLKPIQLEENTIVEKAYYHYLFADPNCQKNLDIM